MKLSELQIGHKAVVKEVGGSGALRQHFLDMGLIPGVEVTLVKYAPMGDPLELILHGYELTLRKADAEKIVVEEGYTNNDKTAQADEPAQAVEEHIHAHPGLGETGKFHHHEGEHPLPTKQTLTFALIGNQNCGKTTLFNQLTGANQHVGNFPGVTVDRRTAR